ncbi:MAG: hypothetical protein ACYDHN_00795, partial [Solirubrobacteraceae bacterium]
MAVSPQQRAAGRAELLEVDLARELVLGAVRPLPPEEVATADALERVLAEGVVADAPVPTFDGSAMDGYAVRAADVAAAGDVAPAVLRVID